MGTAKNLPYDHISLDLISGISADVKYFRPPSPPLDRYMQKSGMQSITFVNFSSNVNKKRLRKSPFARRSIVTHISADAYCCCMLVLRRVPSPLVLFFPFLSFLPSFPYGLRRQARNGERDAHLRRWIDSRTD